MAKIFRVILSKEQRDGLARETTCGVTRVRRFKRAQVLLLADESAGAKGLTDEEICQQVGVSVPTIERIRKQFVREGGEATLKPKRPVGRQYRKLDGAAEARLVALACSPPPEGRVRWTLKLLADRLVELEVVDSVGTTCVWSTLKKTNSSLG